MRPPVRSIEFTQVTEWNDGAVHSLQDSLASEEPLELRVGGTPLTVTMRTPGHDLELAAGFLLTEGIIESRDQVAKICTVAPDSVAKSNVVEAQLIGTQFTAKDVQRNFFTASSCGICGKASIEAIRHRNLRVPDRDFRVSPEVLCQLPEKLRTEQTIFDRTGGLHAAALFDAQGNLIVLREDIGRHNALDKLAGWALLEGRLPLNNFIMLVSGRGASKLSKRRW